MEDSENLTTSALLEVEPGGEKVEPSHSKAAAGSGAKLLKRASYASLTGIIPFGCFALTPMMVLILQMGNWKEVVSNSTVCDPYTVPSFRTMEPGSWPKAIPSSHLLQPSGMEVEAVVGVLIKLFEECWALSDMRGVWVSAEGESCEAFSEMTEGPGAKVTEGPRVPSFLPLFDPRASSLAADRERWRVSFFLAEVEEGVKPVKEESESLESMEDMDLMKAKMASNFSSVEAVGEGVITDKESDSSWAGLEGRDLDLC